MYICVNGKFKISQKEERSFSPGIFPGPGAFETMRVEKRLIIFFDEHISRMQRSLRRLGIKFTISSKYLEQKIHALLKKNALSRARIRYMVCCCKDTSSIKEIIICGRLNPKQRNPSVIISDICRKKARLSHLKTTDYSCFKEAFDAAKRKGYDDAVLLNSNKEVVECAHSNIFIIKRNKIFTPPVISGCLSGIARSWVMKTACKNGFIVACNALKEKDLYSADEIFCTNSVAGVIPIVRINGKYISDGNPGHISEELCSLYERMLFRK